MTFSGTTVSKRECHGLFTFLLKYKFTTFRTCYYQTGALSQKWFSHFKLFFAVMTPFALRMYVRSFFKYLLHTADRRLAECWISLMLFLFSYYFNISWAKCVIKQNCFLLDFCLGKQFNPSDLFWVSANVSGAP